MNLLVGAAGNAFALAAVVAVVAAAVVAAAVVAAVVVAASSERMRARAAFERVLLILQKNTKKNIDSHFFNQRKRTST